jgi:hypothetical protein
MEESSEEIKLEVTRLMVYGYKFELEAISHRSLTSLLPAREQEQEHGGVP